MKEMNTEQKYKKLVEDISIRLTEESNNQEESERLERIAKYLGEVKAQTHLRRAKYEKLLEYIDKQYDGTEETLREICSTLDESEDINGLLHHNAQTKYREVTAAMQILATRAVVENNQEAYERLKRLSQYLEEVRIQRHLCQPSEIDRIENVRYRELLEYIDNKYDGTEETIKEICRTLDKREDVDEVLKYHDKKNNQSKGTER